jgi:hypothetical protein
VVGGRWFGIPVVVAIEVGGLERDPSVQLYRRVSRAGQLQYHS